MTRPREEGSQPSFQPEVKVTNEQFGSFGGWMHKSDEGGGGCFCFFESLWGVE